MSLLSFPSRSCFAIDWLLEQACRSFVICLSQQSVSRRQQDASDVCLSIPICFFGNGVCFFGDGGPKCSPPLLSYSDINLYIRYHKKLYIIKLTYETEKFLELEPIARFELATFTLRKCCSSTELYRQSR